jgi:hypothetical protein
MSTKRPAPPGDQSFETVGGAAELAGVGLEGLSHAGPLALLVGLVAIVVTKFVWFRRRRAHS